MVRSKFTETRNMLDLRPNDILVLTYPKRHGKSVKEVTERTVLHYRGDIGYTNDGTVIIQKGKLLPGVKIRDHVPYDEDDMWGRVWIQMGSTPNVQTMIDDDGNTVYISRIPDGLLVKLRNGNGGQESKTYVKLTADQCDGLGAMFINQANAIRQAG